jgi:hypothetical protein
MNLQTCPTYLSPQAISERIERCVRLRTGGMIRGLRVDVAEESVVISGRTTTYYNKQLATHAALDAAKEISLTNDIEVC